MAILAVAIWQPRLSTLVRRVHSYLGLPNHFPIDPCGKWRKLSCGLGVLYVFVGFVDYVRSYL